MRSEIEHWLDCKTISDTDPFLRSRPAIIWYLRRLVHGSANTMPRIVANDSVTEFLCMLLHRPTDVTDPVIRPAGLDTKFQTLLSNADKLLKLGSNLSNRDSRCRISHKTLE